MNGFCSGGKRESQMNDRSKAPEYPDIRIPIPRSNPNPTPKRPIIKSQSTTAFPARCWKKEERGPCVPNVRYPKVGEAPIIQALSGEVAKPNPNTLSINAHKKIQLMPSLKKVQMYFPLSSFIVG